LIDAGANIEPTPEHLVGYAVMGSIYAKEVMGYANPRVGLVSIGAEAGKGNEFTKDTFKLLTASKVNFVATLKATRFSINQLKLSCAMALSAMSF